MNEPHYDPDHTQVRSANSATGATQRSRRVVRRRDSDATVSDPSATQVASHSYGYTDRYAQQSGAATGREAYGSRAQSNNAYGHDGSYPRNAYGQPAAPVASPAQEQPRKKESPVSMPVAIGSALSAVTSLFLSSHIGIGGSVVTVAVGAIASSLMSQAYTHIVSKSAEKMKDLSSNSGSQQISGVMDSSQLGSYSLSEDGTDVASTGTPIASSELHDAAAKRQGNITKRRGIIITIIVALAMVLVTAGIITFATQGSGIGTKTTPIIATTSPTPGEEATTTDESQVPQKDGEDNTSSTENSNEKGTASDSTKSDSGKPSSNATNSSTSSNSTNGSSSTGESNKENSSSSKGDSNNGSSSNNGQSSSGTSGSTNGGANSSNTSNSGTSPNSASGSSSSGSKENGSGTSSSTSGTSSGSAAKGTSTQSSSTEK